VLPEEARTTASVVPNCRSQGVEGNHITMLFGRAASSIAASIAEFVEPEETS
jgi:hypothetical protein